MAAEMAINGKSGLIGLDENNSGNLGLIDLQLIKGGKEFDTSQSWFADLLKEIDQE